MLYESRCTGHKKSRPRILRGRLICAGGRPAPQILWVKKTHRHGARVHLWRSDRISLCRARQAAGCGKLRRSATRRGQHTEPGPLARHRRAKGRLTPRSAGEPVRICRRAPISYSYPPSLAMLRIHPDRTVALLPRAPRGRCTSRVATATISLRSASIHQSSERSRRARANTIQTADGVERCRKDAKALRPQSAVSPSSLAVFVAI